MINLTHAGYESVATYNLSHPTKKDLQYKWQIMDQLRWFLLKLPQYSGRCYKKDYPEETFWGPSDVYFTFYKGMGSNNKGDRMICFYIESKPIDMDNIDWGDNDEALY